MKHRYPLLLPLSILGVMIFIGTMTKGGKEPLLELIPGIPFDISIIPMMIIFWLAYVILDRNIFKPIFSVLQTREETAARADTRFTEAEKDLAAVREEWEDRLHATREELRGEREELRARLAENRAEAVAKARADAEAKLAKAGEELDREREDAAKTLKDYAETMAKLMAEKILGRKCA